MSRPLPAASPAFATADDVWLGLEGCRLDDLAALVEAGSRAPKPPRAAELAQGIPIYDCRDLRARLHDERERQALMAEWHQVFDQGAGVLVLAGAWDDTTAIEQASAAFFAMIEREKSTGAGGDHFAKAGANNRVWNALQKLALDAPDVFARYYANPTLDLVSRAWLGPGYQVTSQVNCVNPGGEAQSPHRDYHLGFLTAQQALPYPAAVHRMSPHLTLQGAVAHVDMPVASGPTLMLPHSQKYLHGYLVAGRQDFTDFFLAHRAQLPLARGDAVWFNPALLHAAGTNRSTGIRRLANLLQVSSAFGRAMESVDRLGMSLAVYPALLEAVSAQRLSQGAADCAIAACAEGYAFPTNLDTDPPLGGLAPPSQQALMSQALRERWPATRFDAEARARIDRQRP